MNIYISKYQCLFRICINFSNLINDRHTNSVVECINITKQSKNK